jgi:aminoglycoside 6'-N-acetyltransferase I
MFYLCHNNLVVVFCGSVKDFRNLYPNIWKYIATIQNLRQHPYEFYQNCGFVIVGVMPDANGLGKPDIYMAKQL